MSDEFVPQYLFSGVNPTNEDDPFAELVAREGEFRGTPYEDSHTLVDQKKKLSLAKALLGRAIQEQAARKPGPLGTLGWRYWAPESTGQALDPGYADDSNAELKKKVAAAREMREDASQRMAGNTTAGKPITWVNRQEPERKGFMGPPAVNVEATVKPPVSQDVKNIVRQGAPRNDVQVARQALQRELVNGAPPEQPEIGPDLRATLLDRMLSGSALPRPVTEQTPASFGRIQPPPSRAESQVKNQSRAAVLGQMERGELPKSPRLMALLTGGERPLNRASRAGIQRIIANPNGTLLETEPVRGRLNQMTQQWADLRDLKKNPITPEEQAFANGEVDIDGQPVRVNPLAVRAKELRAQSRRSTGNAAYNNQRDELLAMSDDPAERRAQVQGGQFSVQDRLPLGDRLSGSNVDSTNPQAARWRKLLKADSHQEKPLTILQRMEHLTGRQANHGLSGDSFGDYANNTTLSRPDGKGNRIATSDVVVDEDGKIALKGVIGGESANRKRNESLSAAQNMRDRMSLGSTHAEIGINDGREGKEIVDNPTPAYLKAYEIGRRQRSKAEAKNSTGDGNLTPLELAVLGRGLQNAKTATEAGNLIGQFAEMNNNRQRNRLAEKQLEATREQTVASQKNDLRIGREAQQDEKQKQVTLLGQAKAQYENRLVGIGEGKPLSPEQVEFVKNKIAELTDQQNRLLSQIGPDESSVNAKPRRSLPQAVSKMRPRSSNQAVSQEFQERADVNNRRRNVLRKEYDDLVRRRSQKSVDQRTGAPTQNGSGLSAGDEKRYQELRQILSVPISVPAATPAF